LVAVYEDNLLIGFNLIRAAVGCGVKKFVNLMPNCTYPGALEAYSEERWWDGPLHPTVMTYAMPRKALWVQSWAYRQEREFRSIHLVLPNMYGPGGHFDESAHALGALVRKVMEAKANGSSEIEIWGTGRPVREWLYVEDAAEGIVLAAERYDDIEIMNLGRGEGCSIRELAELIADVARWSGEFFYDTTRPDGAQCKILDVKKMKAVLRWSPPTGLRDGISRTIEWFNENKEATKDLASFRER
jgi:GDP-L-fucose synthase